MSVADKRRAGRFFPSEAHELREIARRVKVFGLPGPSTARAVESMRRIADRIDGRADTLEGSTQGEGGVKSLASPCARTGMAVTRRFFLRDA